MELSTTGLIGAVIGAVIGFIIYMVVFGLIETNARKIDRPESERQAMEQGLSRIRLILMVSETAIMAFLGYWIATTML